MGKLMSSRRRGSFLAHSCLSICVLAWVEFPRRGGDERLAAFQKYVLAEGDGLRYRMSFYHSHRNCP